MLRLFVRTSVSAGYDRLQRQDGSESRCRRPSSGWGRAWMRTRVERYDPSEVAVAQSRHRIGMIAQRWRVGLAATAAMIVFGTPAIATSAGLSPLAQSAFAPAATSWLNASTGFVLGENACVVRLSNCTSILFTRDGGRTFTSASGPPVSLASRDPASTEAVSHLLFVSPRVGYAWGPGIWMTTDGARHWTFMGPTDVVAVLAGAGMVDVLVQSCAASAATCASPGLDVWRAPIGVASLSLATRLVGAGRWLAAEQDNVGVIALVSAPPVGPSQIWRSLDGGATWSLGGQPCDPRAAMAPGAVAVTQGGILVECGGSPGSGQQAKVLFVSADGGTTFVDVGAAPLNGEFEQVAAYGLDTVALTASSVGDEIDVSVDGGLHYTTTTIAGEGASLTSLAWTGPTSAVVVEGGPGLAGPNRLLVTLDAGVHWRTLPLSVGTPAPPISANTVWAGAVRTQASAAVACLERSTSAASMSCLRGYLLSHGAPTGAVAFVEYFHAYLVGWRPGAIRVGDELSLVPMDCGCEQMVLFTPASGVTTPVPHPGGPGWTALARFYPLPGGGSGLVLAGLRGWVESASSSPNAVTLQYPLVNRCSSCAVPYRLRLTVHLDASGTPGPAVDLGPCLVSGAAHPPDRNVTRCPPVEAWLA